MKTKWSIQKLTYTGVLAAAADIPMSLEFSVPMMPSFHRIDFSGVLSVIALFLMGLASAAWVEIIRIIIRFIMVGINSIYVGEFANLVGVALFVIPVWAVYKKGGKTRRAVIASPAASAPIRTLFARFCNVFITLPLYAAAMGLLLSQVTTTVAAVNPAISDLTTFIFLAIISFNLVKSGLNCLVGYLLYTGLLAACPAVGTV